MFFLLRKNIKSLGRVSEPGLSWLGTRGSIESTWNPLSKALENAYIEEKFSMNLVDRITLNPRVMKGKPTIRNMRFSVAQMLELLAGGMSFEEILADYPFIEPEDIQASLMYAAMIANTRTIRKLSV